MRVLLFAMLGLGLGCLVPYLFLLLFSPSTSIDSAILYMYAGSAIGVLGGIVTARLSDKKEPAESV